MGKKDPWMIALRGNWRLVHPERKIDVPANVPGSVFEELINHGIIPDPFYGMHENEMSWIYEAEWEYYVEFDLPFELSEDEDLSLTFQGIDTFATVYFNDEKIGIAKNMHREYDFPIMSRELVRKRGNRLRICFQSAVNVARDQWEKEGAKQWSSVDTLPGVYFLRKAQYSFGWDWGPKLPDIGLWRGVYLKRLHSLRLEDFRYQASYEYLQDIIDQANLKVSFDIAGFDYYDSLSFSLSLIDPSGNRLIGKEGTIDNESMTRTLRVDHPNLWWTHDLGEQPLYRLHLQLFHEETLHCESTLKIGLRDLQLNREKDQWGESFYFTLNGVKLFAKGANWVPPDSFIPRAIRQGKYPMLLQAARDANMNMIRVWGGGIYEEDLFYDLCDEMGLLVWQDFAFACAPLPNDPELVISIRQEAIDNIHRLRHHPSLCIWVGNNEIEEGWVHWGFEDHYPEGKAIYQAVFEEMLPGLVDQMDPDRPYWPSSPSSGGSFQDPQSPHRGDSHYWKVWHDQYPFSSYREFPSRFMSEFGFESFPSMKTIRSFCPEDQMEMHSVIMEAHQKNPAGNQKILAYMQQRFRIPESFEQQAILSQITQAEAIEYGVEFWRRNRNDCRCMGSLYWQLNDCWPVASWSSIDYFGRWKALHYLAKRFYAPLFLSAQEETDKISLWITNDYPHRRKTQVRYGLYHADGRCLLADGLDIEAPSLASKKVWETGYDRLSTDDSPQELILFFEAYEGNRIISKNARLLGVPKGFPLKDPGVSWELAQTDDSGFQFLITIEAQEIALYVWIDTEQIDFVASDNFFPMKKGERREIEIHTNESVCKERLQKEIRLSSLFHLVR